MSEGIGIFVVSFFVGLVGVLLPQYILHLLRMRRVREELAYRESVEQKWNTHATEWDDFASNFNKERAEIKARIKQGVRRTNGRIK